MTEILQKKTCIAAFKVVLLCLIVWFAYLFTYRENKAIDMPTDVAIDSYFEKTLDVVKVGVQTVVKKYNRRYVNLSVYLAECDQSGFFSVENKHFEFILDSSKWDSEIAPSIADILQYSNQLDTIPAGEPFECLKEYIIYRMLF